MKFEDLQETVRALVAGAASFGASKVVYDFGFQKSDLEDLIDMETSEDRQTPGPGYAAGIWPVTHAQLTSDDASGEAPVLARVVVRLEVNPKLIKRVYDSYTADNSLPRPDKFINGLIKEIINAVLADPPEAGGVTFQLDGDAFEMVNFDEGLMAFHIRFKRFCVL